MTNKIKENAIEIWADIIGYEGLYQISNYGLVKSLDRFVKCRSGYKRKVKGKFITPGLVGVYGNYQSVALYKNKIFKKFYIHRLVAMHFIGNSKGYDEVNHIDGNTQNNIYSNLEWCSHSENITHSYRVLKNNNPMLNKCGSLNQSSKPIKITLLESGKEYYFESQHLASKSIGISQYNISRYLAQKRKSRKYLVELWEKGA